MSAAPATASKASPDFVISRTFDAPRDLVWRCFTDPARMAKWWGPKGVTAGIVKLDLRPGGMCHYTMTSPDGKVMWGKSVYREIKAPERLVFINSFSDENAGLTRHPLAPTWPMEMPQSSPSRSSRAARPSSPSVGRRTIRPRRNTRRSTPATTACGWAGPVRSISSKRISRKRTERI